MTEAIIWGSAALIYLAFRRWYDGSGKPLTDDEIERFAQIMDERAARGLDKQDPEVIKKFMRDDDGKEFIMVNMVKLNPSPVKHPKTGQDMSVQAVLTEYFKPFMKKMFRRAGHPVFTSRIVGGYIDAWNTPVDPGWHVASLVRYRSRRDGMELSLANESFNELHEYKIAAIQQTFATPSQVQNGFYASPRTVVALVLALAAAITQLIVS